DGPGVRGTRRYSIVREGQVRGHRIFGRWKMTTNLFLPVIRLAKAKAALRGTPRPVPSFAYPNPAAMASNPAVAAPIVATQQPLGQGQVSPAPAPPFLQDIPLGMKAAAVSTPQIDQHSTSEERAGGGNPRSAPA